MTPPPITMIDHRCLGRMWNELLVCSAKVSLKNNAMLLVYCTPIICPKRRSFFCRCICLYQQSTTNAKVQESSKDQLTVPQHCFKPVHANLHNTRDLYTNVGHPAGSSCAPQCLHNVGQWTQCWTLRGTMLTQPDLSLPGQSRAFTVSAITIKVPGAIVLTFYPGDCWTNIKCDGWRNARKWTKNYDRSWTKF